MSIRKGKVPDFKVKAVKDLAKKMKESKTILLASCKGLPSAQFHDLKKKMRGVAEIVFLKKNAISRAIDATEKGSLQVLKEQLKADFVLLLSSIDAFELAATLAESQIPTRAKGGDIAPEDIEIQPGPTDLVPGPAISELSGVGLKVAVKEGKLEVIKGAVVAKKGEPIKDNVASVLAKLGISPMKFGFIPLAAYDSGADKVYVDIRIDKPATLAALQEAIVKSQGFAVSIKYLTPETLKYFISIASMEEKAVAKLLPMDA